MKPIIAVFIGEATGVGPEIVAKLCAEDRLKPHCRPVLVGDARVLEMGARFAGVAFPYVLAKEIAEVDWDGPVAILDQGNLDPSNLKMGAIDTESGKVTGDTLITICELLKRKKIDGLTYASLNKQAYKLGGHNFPGDLHFFSHYLGHGELVGELNLLNNLWVARVTSHIPLGQVTADLKQERILQTVMLANETIGRTGIDRPRIAVAALNPHAGEGGLCGREEIDIISPAIQDAREKGCEVFGPFSADTVFINAFRGDYDAVITMYHDQGHIAMKIKGFEFAVTVHGGLPYPVTTPAHGTAFDIAGKGVARVDSTERAIIVAARMAEKS